VTPGVSGQSSCARAVCAPDVTPASTNRPNAMSVKAVAGSARALVPMSPPLEEPRRITVVGHRAPRTGAP